MFWAAHLQQAVNTIWISQKAWVHTDVQECCQLLEWKAWVSLLLCTATNWIYGNLFYKKQTATQLDWGKKTLSCWENKNANAGNRFLKWTWLPKMRVCGIKSRLKEEETAHDWLITILYSCWTEALRLQITLRSGEPVPVFQWTNGTLFCHGLPQKLIKKSVKVLIYPGHGIVLGYIQLH